jgi:hypothetical protein
VRRSEQPRLPDERTALEAALDFQRETLLLKCAGLTGDQLKQCSIPPATLSLLGLVRHLAGVERWWFRRNFAGQQLPDIYSYERSPDAEFDEVDDADPEADFATYSAEVQLAREATAGHDLDETFMRATHFLLPGVEPVELNRRGVFVDLIAEYARHNGHADLLRQRIDGVTGD